VAFAKDLLRSIRRIHVDYALKTKRCNFLLAVHLIVSFMVDRPSAQAENFELVSNSVKARNLLYTMNIADGFEPAALNSI